MVKQSQTSKHFDNKSNSFTRLNRDHKINSKARLNFNSEYSDWCKHHQADSNNLTPTYEAYGAVQFAYDYFNRALFDGQLPNVLITFTHNRNIFGYFSLFSFENNSKSLSYEIRLNPQYTKLLRDRETLSTLLHELVHLWRYKFGLPSKNIGGGKGSSTGYGVINTVNDDSPFDVACKALFNEIFHFKRHDTTLSETVSGTNDGSVYDDLNGAFGSKRKKDKIRFTCPSKSCGLNAWAKPSAKIICRNCNLPMVSKHAASPTPLSQNPNESSNLTALLIAHSTKHDNAHLNSTTNSMTVTKGA